MDTPNPSDFLMVDQVKDQIEKSANESMFDVSDVGAHSHTGVDAPHVNFANLDNRYATGSVTIQGLSAATASNYSVFFVAPYQMRILNIYEVHTTAGNDAGTVSLNIERLTGTQAPGGGVLLLTSVNSGVIFNLKSAANTIQTGTLMQSATVGGQLRDPRVLDQNTRLAFVLTGTPTNVANVTVSLSLGF